MTPLKPQLHPRNKHNKPYDFEQLITSAPELAPFVITNGYGNISIDFSNSKAVKTLNKAILKLDYNIEWDLPEPFLCPPIPGRADYIHYLADLLSSSNGGVIPRGKKVTVLDIGVGANCIYPLIGHREYGWSFVGTDIDRQAIAIANKIIEKNGLTKKIKIIEQTSPSHIFKGLPDLKFDISICNPPFHASVEQAKEAVKRKWKNLNIKTNSLNFGGQSNELWCPGGEVAFIKQMIQESSQVNCKWFTALVSKASSLPSIYSALNKLTGIEVKTINMSQGQKKSRIIAWRST